MGLFAATIVVTSHANAAGSVPGPLTLSVSASNLVLSFPTTSTDYYGLQTCSNLFQPWMTLQSGIHGNGSLVNLTVAAPSLSQGFYRVVLQSPPTSLLLPQSDAFAILGHSCGGIQELVYATGFDPVSGYPMGFVHLQTRCSTGGRGGGTTTYTAWAAATWDFGANVISSAAISTPVVDPAFATTDAFGDSLYNTSGLAYLAVPLPSAPGNVNAVQSGDAFLVNWMPNGISPIAVTSSTLTATPIDSSATVLTATVTGSGTHGAIDLLEPQTTYQITVVNNALSGSGPASAPITLTTPAASLLPSAPTNVTAHWVNLDPPGTTDTLVAGWSAANPGDSPIDQYRVAITPSDGGSAVTNTVSGATLTTSFVVDFGPNWTLRVQAHNAVGWGPTSTPVTLGGL